MRLSRWLGVASVLAALVAGLNLSGCASMEPAAKQRQVASVLTYLYPGNTTLEALPPAGVAELNVPFRLGLAFVPDAEAKAQFRLPETDRLRLLSVVRWSRTTRCSTPTRVAGRSSTGPVWAPTWSKATATTSSRWWRPPCSTYAAAAC